MQRTRIAVAYDCLFPYTTGGGERLYRSYAEHLHSRGMDVDYLTARQWRDQDAPESPDFRIVPVTGALRLYGVDGVRRSVAALRFAWGLFCALARNRRAYGAIIVSGLPVLNVFAVRAALVGSSTRIVVDYLEVWGLRQWVDYSGPAVGTAAWTLQRLAVAMTPIATCHSRLTAAQLRRAGMRGTVLVSPGLIDAESSHQLVETPAEPAYALFAGRHIADKRVSTLPAAVAEARREFPDLHLVVLGSGPDTPAVESAIADAGGEGWTEMPGFVSQERLDELMAGAAALVNPSRREGYGLVVVEAAAHGTPVVLVEDAGNAATELIEEGVNGFVAGSASATDLGRAILQAVRGGAQLRRSARAWYDTAVKTRTVGRTVDGILAQLGLATTTPEKTEEPSPGNTEGRQ